MSPILATRGLSKSFGALTVADSIDFSIEQGARHALIGPNGAGKTTLINLITGRIAPTSGQILLSGSDVTGLSQAARTRLGIGRTFQINQLFSGLSVLENVAMAVSERQGLGWRMLRPFGSRSAMLDEAAAIAVSFGLGPDCGAPVNALSYGRQRLVEIAIAFALKPALLLLDEPAAGVPADESRELLDSIDRLPGSVSVLIVEHDMDVVFRFARRITVLDQGRIFAEGPPADIARNDEVRRIYFGERGVAHG